MSDYEWNGTDSEVDRKFQEFWVPIIFDLENGRLNLEQLKKELYDYSMLLDHVPKVYSEVTGGRVSKPNTLPGAVIQEFNEYMQEVVDDAIKDEQEAE